MSVSIVTVATIKFSVESIVTIDTIVTKLKKVGDVDMKQVQISENLFLSLIKYHIFECYNEKEKIVEELQQKFDGIINRNLYTKYKTAPTAEEKEKAKQEYLDRKGIHSSFRW